MQNNNTNFREKNKNKYKECTKTQLQNIPKPIPSWSSFRFYRSTQSFGVRVKLLGTSWLTNILPFFLAKATGINCLPLCTFLFKSLHRCWIGFRSGLWTIPNPWSFFGEGIPLLLKGKIPCHHFLVLFNNYWLVFGTTLFPPP